MAENPPCLEQSMRIQSNPPVCRAAASALGPRKAKRSAAGAQLTPPSKGERSSVEVSHPASRGL